MSLDQRIITFYLNHLYMFCLSMCKSLVHIQITINLFLHGKGRKKEIVGKGPNTVYLHFHLFPLCFLQTCLMSLTLGLFSTGLHRTFS